MQQLTRFHFSLITRMALLACVFTLEIVFITIQFDGQALLSRGGLIAGLGLSGSWLLRFIVASATLFVTFAVLQIRDRNRDTLRDVSDHLSTAGTVRPVWLAAHIGLLTLFFLLAQILYGTSVSGASANRIAICWLIAGTAAILSGAGAFIPFGLWQLLLRSTGYLWIYAAATSAGACLLGAYSRALWNSAADWTFVLVKGMLRLFLSGVFIDTSIKSIGTQAFHVEIAPECSGLEGAALILGFCTLWLWLLRREFRFPHALVMAPLSVAVLFVLNAVRIAVLILIGNAGAPEIALGGFHSQAGWIAFNVVAIVLIVAARRVQWITVGHAGAAALGDSSRQTATAVEENPAAPYLVPFLAILVAAMVSRAVSGSFEWFYALRLLACGTALWVYRASYRELDWHFGWEAPVVGSLVFALWLGGDWLSGSHPQNPLIPNANAWMATAQSIWLVLRILTSILAVPIAEELAFRGYLIRRIMSVDFEHLSPSAFTALSLIISSLAFGILHGERWIAGTVAGLLYAAVLIRRGRIGDAIVAHATTNGLLAVSVIVTGQWNLS